jgi:hypothetical protein
VDEVFTSRVVHLKYSQLHALRGMLSETECSQDLMRACREAIHAHCLHSAMSDTSLPGSAPHIIPFVFLLSRQFSSLLLLLNHSLYLS